MVMPSPFILESKAFLLGGWSFFCSVKMTSFISRRSPFCCVSNENISSTLVVSIILCDDVSVVIAPALMKLIKLLKDRFSFVGKEKMCLEGERGRRWWCSYFASRRLCGDTSSILISLFV